MTGDLVERQTDCPFCGETIDLFIDASAGAQSYIEDCSVCCQPIQVSFTVHEDDVDSLSIDRAD
ncbi:MAG: CPXCG motif-containing cysteine-rich protein [Pseudomonadota bacterium]